VYLLFILDLGTRWGEWSASRPGRALAPGKGPRYPLYRRLGGPQSRSGHRSYWKNPLSVPRIEPRSPGGPARSQTLHRLSYPAHSLNFRYTFTAQTDLSDGAHFTVKYVRSCAGNLIWCFSFHQELKSPFKLRCHGYYKLYTNKLK
jgi:hypothetical protein